ncbi:hypothetical protein O181_077067 [Austropuccinia psidii MF-1]|uniref:Uncharacterized protein n=1 Tax=Austropuccinia psidii MF-1 TaxID=1389203 RepID=A0A9Q3FFE0_9BASI|nr:hypothetical protein [Austropuccinia psidii MF-1]
MEGIAYQNEIDELLKTKISSEEEEEVQKQLIALQKSQEKDEDAQPLPSLPNAPKSELPQKNSPTKDSQTSSNIQEAIPA